MKRVIRLYYCYQFFFNLLLWLPIFYEYQKHFGLSNTQIFDIQSIYYLAFCVLEIPTGMIADWWGHRRCLRWGAVTLVLSNLLPIVAPTFGGFLVHFLLIALARSFISGASSAYLYNYLAGENAVPHYKQVEGNARAYGLVGKVVCWPAVGFLMQWQVTLPYWLTVVAALISVVYAWKLPQPAAAVPKPGERELPLAARLWGVTAILRRSPFLILLMIQGIGLFVLARICQVNLFQPILLSKSVDLGFHGTVMSIMTVFEAVGSARPGWIQRWMDDLNAVFLLTAIMAVSLLLIPFAGAWGTVVWLSVFAYATGLSFPIQRQLLNDNIVQSDYRATLLSVESILDRGVCAWVAALIGGFLQAGHLDSFLVISAVVTLGAMLVLLVALRVRIPVRRQA